jgi:hypothetical protein
MSQRTMEDHHEGQDDASLWDLPEPAILTPREMLDTREDVNVLGECRCLGALVSRLGRPVADGHSTRSQLHWLDAPNVRRDMWLGW